MGQLGRAEEGAEILLSLVLDEKAEDEARRFAVSTLGQLGSLEEKFLDALLGLARDERTPDEVRVDAYKSLKRLLGGGMP
ncbi:MAG: hypothetical protein ABIK79_03165 [Chloroflexota bacterium]